jgi:hypothetical protein
MMLGRRRTVAPAPAQRRTCSKQTKCRSQTALCTLTSFNQSMRSLSVHCFVCCVCTDGKSAVCGSRRQRRNQSLKPLPSSPRYLCLSLLLTLHVLCCAVLCCAVLRGGVVWCCTQEYDKYPVVRSVLTLLRIVESYIEVPLPLTKRLRFGFVWLV